MMRVTTDMLNLGCGARFHPSWTNVDVSPSSTEVIQCDLGRGLPFSDGQFAVVYHSHVLEHFPAEKGLALLSECFRVLQPSGTLRVVVPDLEGIARCYLNALDEHRKGNPGFEKKHEWMILEMYDQTVRQQSRGAIAPYLQANPDLKPFVLSRWGDEAKQLFNDFETKSLEKVAPRNRLQNICSKVRKLSNWQRWREKFVQLLLGAECGALEIGRFRSRGEVHLCMYDELALRRSLLKVGFVHPKRVNAATSLIKDWTGFHLDTNSDGSIYKPDSLYMEAIKP